MLPPNNEFTYHNYVKQVHNPVTVRAACYNTGSLLQYWQPVTILAACYNTIQMLCLCVLNCAVYINFNPVYTKLSCISTKAHTIWAEMSCKISSSTNCRSLYSLHEL